MYKRQRLQPALVVAGYGPSGPEGRFFAPGFIGVDDAAQRRAFTNQLE